MTLIVNSIMTDPPKGGLKRPTKKPANQTPNSVYTTDTASVEIGKKVEKPKKESKRENINNKQEIATKETKEKYRENMNSAYEKFIKNSHYDAEQLYKDLKNPYSDPQEDIEYAFNQLNKDNIVVFLKEYYEASEYKGELHGNKFSPSRFTIGLIDRADTRKDEKSISMSSKLNAVKSLLDAAKMLHVDDCKEYRKIDSIYNRYKSTNKENLVGNSKKREGSWKPFLTTLGTISAGAIIGGLVASGWGAIGGGILGEAVGVIDDYQDFHNDKGVYEPEDSEILDSNMYALHQKIMKALEEE